MKTINQYREDIKALMKKAADIDAKCTMENRDITEAETRAADELWMCSSTKEVLPIVLLDGVRVGGDGTPGPKFAQMYAWYQAFKATVMRGK